jgi:hypothetical protein
VKPGSHAFLSGWDALFILIGLHFAETVIGSVLWDFRVALRLDDTSMAALTLLLASGVVFTLAMRFTRTGYRELFHAAPVSAVATAAVLLLPVLALVPALVLAGTAVTDWLVTVTPLSRWEEELFEGLAPTSVASVVLVCLLAPVLEEMLFRGLILRGFLARYPRWPAIVGSAVLFGAAHLNIYQFFVGLLIGVPLGWLYERTRSLIPCIALHAAYNGAITWLELQREAGADVWWEGTAAGWALAVPLAAAAGLWLARILQPARA